MTRDQIMRLPVVLFTIFAFSYVHAFRVAIIGSGIGGASSAYHLARTAAVDIDIYDPEPNGRTCTTKFHGLPVDLGASIFVAANQFMMNFTQMLNLSLDFNPMNDGTVENSDGLWNGREFVWIMRDRSWYNPRDWWDKFWLGWKYGFSTMSQVKALTNRFVDDFSGLYHPKRPFSSLQEIVHDMQYSPLLTTSLREFLVYEHGINEKFVDDIVNAATRVNYAMDADVIHALAGMVSLAPFVSPAYAIKYVGMQGLVQGLVKASNATFYNQRVHQIERIDGSVNVNEIGEKSECLSLSWTVQARHAISGMIDYSNEKSQFSTCGIHTTPPKYRITTTPHHAKDYDAIVLATPVHSSGINFTEGDWNEFTPLVDYTTLHVTLIRGDINPVYFNMKDVSQLPSSILTSAEYKPDFRSLTMLSVDEHGQSFKMFSDEPLNDDLLNELFQNISMIQRKQWKSYPKMTPKNIQRWTASKFILLPGLFYVNAFEPMISTMETEAMSGHNVARLVKALAERVEMA